MSYIWSIADDWLRDVYVPSDYRKVILPMVVLRRLDLVLEPTKAKVLEMKRALDGDKVVFTDPKASLVEIIDFRENTNCPNPDDAKLAFAKTSFAGQAASLIRVGGMGQLSKKPFKVWTRNLTMPDPAIPLFDAKKLPEHWTVKE